MFYSIWSNQEVTFDCVLQLSYMVRVVVHKGVREEGGGGGVGKRETETETETKREGNRKNSWFSFREVAKISELNRFIIYLDHLVEGGPEKCCQL